MEIYRTDVTGNDNTVFRHGSTEIRQGILCSYYVPKNLGLIYSIRQVWSL